MSMSIRWLSSRSRTSGNCNSNGSKSLVNLGDVSVDVEAMDCAACTALVSAWLSAHCPHRPGETNHLTDTCLAFFVCVGLWFCFKLVRGLQLDASLNAVSCLMAKQR